MDFTRASQLIPHVESTLASYENILQSGSKNQSSNILEYAGTLEELREMLGIVIQQSIENGEFEKLQQQLELHDRITDTIKIMQEGEVDFPGKQEEKQEKEKIEQVEAIDTHQILKTLEEEEDKELNIPPEDFLCSVCFDDIKKEDGYMFSDCFHYFCKECLEGYLNSKIMEGDVVNIPCMQNDCDSPVLVRDIQNIVSKEMFQKFENFSILSFLRSNPYSRWCPYPGCEGTFIGDEEMKGKIACPTCGKYFCFDCTLPWHENMTCYEAKKSNEDDDPKTQKWKKKHGVKQCPHCGLDTIRISGCPDMICSNCKKHWDWFYDEPDEWEGDGLRRKSETKLETAAFVYPRFVKLVAGSRDLQDDPEDARLVTGMVAAIGIAGVPLTLVCGPPALAVRSGRNLRNKFKRRFSQNNEKK